MPVSNGSLPSTQVTDAWREEPPCSPMIAPMYSPPAAVRLTVWLLPAAVAGNTLVSPWAVHTAA